MVRAFLHIILLCFFISCGCKQKIKVTEDSVYSRHLQRHVNLTIINTPVQGDRNLFNLLLLNDGQDVESFRIKDIVDSLYKKKMIQPLIIVAINTSDRMKELGIAGYPDFKNNGAAAEKYSGFIADELYPFIKKKTGIKKFNSIILAGCSLGGLSAFDIAWDHADVIDKVGVFSGSFWYRDKDASDSDYSDEKDRIILNKIKSSKKRPHLKYWFYAGDDEEKNDRDKDGITDVVDDTKDLINIIRNKNAAAQDDIVFIEEKAGKHDYTSWSHALPQFLIWAAGK